MVFDRGRLAGDDHTEGGYIVLVEMIYRTTKTKILSVAPPTGSNF